VRCTGPGELSHPSLNIADDDLPIPVLDRVPSGMSLQIGEMLARQHTLHARCDRVRFRVRENEAWIDLP
jgi:hypothetical protein